MRGTVRYIITVDGDIHHMSSPISVREWRMHVENAQNTVQRAAAEARRAYPESRVIALRSVTKGGEPDITIVDARSAYLEHTIRPLMSTRELIRLERSGLTMSEVMATYLYRLDVIMPDSDTVLVSVLAKVSHEIGYHVGRSPSAIRQAHLRLAHHALVSVTAP